MYESKITMLTEMLKKELNTDKVTIQTYVGSSATTVPPEFNGLSIVQYTPYEGEDENCNQIAAVKIWAELNTTPVGNRCKPCIPQTSLI
jgi:hypothetical protein